MASVRLTTAFLHRELSTKFKKNVAGNQSAWIQLQSRFFSTPNKVGFVGLGNMGLPMCANLIRGNPTSSNIDTPLEVVAYDVNDISLRKAEMAGATAASSLSELASCSPHVIFTVLPDCATSTSVLMELASSITSTECIFVDCSTVGVTTSRNNHAMIASHSSTEFGRSYCMFDAPISGGASGAKKGTLTFMLGLPTPNTTRLDEITPYLYRMGKTIHTCGGPGAGCIAKLSNNLALAIQMVGICEALNLGEALGIDPVSLTNVMSSSTAKCWSLDVNNPHAQVSIARGSGASGNGYKGGFATKLMLKDLNLAIRAGEECGDRVALPVGGNVKALYQLVEKRGLGDLDFGVVLDFLKGKR